uniref:Vomeronasal type-1 receptor n=1 Tax=Microcebus murinus TaxID=30608 RepID=A0A1P8NUH0_MICMU|nr:vomeronasal 1 receptor VN1R-Mmur067 [Microcebus murinus]APX52230.1 vomeronasal 1 receptor VN1R-Mmur067 [Microcebus murinus]APX52231.1 vomeronasal 1 receptor VN1R-Mmur067 [Microcebus murinus]APX52232.1 vomeronasal 1 receptor VN1R-Mmur067 [Microcebus murinus]APX52233.1 vomeronasal 1 receptor VN1R-Mmur067 [Microcebus murinus]
MAASEVAMGIILLSLTVVGVVGNFSLICYHLLLWFFGYRIKFTDMIHKHLMVANLLVLLCHEVPQTMAALHWKGFLSTFACKLLFYLHRVGRGVSIGSTSLLSVFQAITISPRSSRLAELKIKTLKYIGSSVYLSWILCILVNSICPMFMTGKWNNTVITGKKDFGYCSSIRHDKTSDILYAALLSFPDVFFVGLMLWASSFMVLVLYRHKQQVQHIHRANVSSRSYPESKATKTILLLVSTFVSFYTLSCIFQVCLSLINYPSLFLVHTTAIFAGCFPAVSPFLLMSCDSSVSRHCFAWIRRRTP